MDIILERQKNLEKTFKLAREKSRKCLVADCEQPAIKSHVFQKNGILDQIASKSHLYKVELTSPFEIATKGPLLFKRIGINDAFTFPGFCKSHDNSVFRKLETKTPDYWKSSFSIY